MTVTTKQNVLDFTHTFSDYYKLVFSSIYSKISNYDEAEDMCQEVFMRYYNKKGEVENPRKWLMWTLHYVILEYFRKKGKSDEDIENFTNDVKMSYVNGFRDTRIMIKEALDNVTVDDDEKEGVIFELIAVHNFSYNAVAKEIGMTYSQVRYVYNQVSARVVDYLKKQGISSLEELL